MRYKVMLTDSNNIFDLDTQQYSTLFFENLSQEEMEAMTKIAVNQPAIMMAAIPICEE